MTPQVRTAVAIRHRVQPIARWLVVATALLILYGSLFPFQFAAFGERGFAALLTSLRFQPTSRGDLVANLLLYMPFGLCLVLAWPAQWRRLTALIATVIVGTLLSLAVELLQVYAPARVSSLTDVIINAVGTLAGGLIALVYLELGTTLRIPGVVSGRPDPVPLGVLLLWLAFRLAPFVPTIDWQKYKDAIKPLLDLLDDRSRRILGLRFFGGMTQSQIAAEVGISQMHVSRLLSRALDTLRTTIET